MFRTGGKRCRPLLVVLSAEALGGKPEEALEAAAAIEIIHAATLVFDDMIDKDQVRRGAPTIHMAFSNEKALTSGLFLASKGVQLLSNYKNPEVMRMIGTTLVDISKGELLDILGDFNASVSECIAIADRKAGSLEFARSKAKEYAGNAKESLDKVKSLEDRKILDDYADYLWKRTE